MKKKKEKNDDEEDEEKPLGLKQWATKTILLLFIFSMLIYATEVSLKIDLLSNFFMVVAISLCFGFAHEYLHYYQAIKLGYKPKWYRTKVTMGFEISHKSARGKWLKDKKKISLLPYKVLLPVSVVIFLVGFFYFETWGIWLGGVMGILLHTIAYPLTEGH